MAVLPNHPFSKDFALETTHFGVFPFMETRKLRLRHISRLSSEHGIWDKSAWPSVTYFIKKTWWLKITGKLAGKNHRDS